MRDSDQSKSSLSDWLFLGGTSLLCLQWWVFHFGGEHLPPGWDALAPGIAIFGAACILSWAAELAQLDIPQALALIALAFIAVLPEYAVDAYFAWEAGSNPEYLAFATANMTGANRLLIGLGWPAVIFLYWFKTKKTELILEKERSLEIVALLAASVYAFIIPLKGTISWVDAVVLFAIFITYATFAAMSGVSEPELEGGPAEHIAKWPTGLRRTVTASMFLFSGTTIYIAAEPFAEGLLGAGESFGIEKFILVQWLAPLASEAPEFIVALVFVWRAMAGAGFGCLLSSKVNQWTLLIGTLPLVYSLSLGELTPMILDARQKEEIFLTAAQSLFAVMILVNLSFSLWEALLIAVLFLSGFFFNSVEARWIYSYMYIGLAGLTLLMPSTRCALVRLLGRGRKSG